MLGQAQKCRVITRKTRKGGRLTQDGNRESVTVIETVSGDGRALPPMVIWQAKTHVVGWYASLIKGTGEIFCTSKKGYTDKKLGKAYLMELFDPKTKDM